MPSSTRDTPTTSAPSVTPRLVSSTLGLALTCLLPNMAHAADNEVQLPVLSVGGQANPAEPGPSYKAEQSGLGKLTQPLLDTPQSVDVVSRALMDDQGTTTLRDALRNVPGISLAAGENGSQGDSLTIRGFTARNDIYIDGVRDFGSYYRDSFNYDSVEVLKGPSSLIFGRGSTGGAVEQNSKMPTLEPLVAGTLAFGTDGTKRVTADIDQPLPELGEGAAFRLNVMGNDNGVAGRTDAEYSRFGIAPSLALGLGTPTRITLSHLHQTEYDIPDYGLPWIYEAGAGTGIQLARPAPNVPGNVSTSNFYGFDHGDFLRTQVDVTTAKVEHDFDDSWHVKETLRYGHYSRSFRITEPQIYATAAAGASGTSLLLSPGANLSNVLVSRNELYGKSLETDAESDTDLTGDFDTGSIHHDLVAGLEFGRETSDPIRYTTVGPYSTTSLLSPNPGQLYNSSTYLASRTATTALSQAGYIADTITLTPEWQVVGGLRLDRFDAAYRLTSYPNPITKVITTPSAALNRVDVMPSWRGAIVYKPTSESSVYFQYGTSFNPSAEALSLASSTSNLAPEKNRTFELGSKWDVDHDRVNLTAALYETEKTNMRETDPNNSAYSILVGSAKAKGLELEAVGHVTDEWQLQASYAYTFSEVTKSPQTDLGHRLANVPMHTASLWTTYELPFKLELGAGVDYVSSRYASTTYTVVSGVSFLKEAPGYVTASLLAKYPVNEKISVQVNVTNLADIKYDDLLHPSHVVPGAGRTAMFTGNFKF